MAVLLREFRRHSEATFEVPRNNLLKTSLASAHGYKRCLALRLHDPRKEYFMRLFRFLSLVAVAAVAAGVIKNIPEIRRYVRMYTL